MKPFQAAVIWFCSNGKIASTRLWRNVRYCCSTRWGVNLFVLFATALANGISTSNSIYIGVLWHSSVLRNVDLMKYRLKRGKKVAKTSNSRNPFPKIPFARAAWWSHDAQHCQNSYPDSSSGSVGPIEEPKTKPPRHRRRDQFDEADTP